MGKYALLLQQILKESTSAQQEYNDLKVGDVMRMWNIEYFIGEHFNVMNMENAHWKNKILSVSFNV